MSDYIEIKSTVSSRKKVRRDKSQRILFIIVGSLLVLYTLTMLYPFLWVLVSSLKTNNEYFASPFALPAEWKFSNYIDAFEILEYNGTNLFGMIFNSAWFTIGVTVLGTLISAMTAYVVARYNFIGKKLFYGVALAVMLLPLSGSLGAGYKLMYNLNIADSPLLLISYAGGYGMNFIILEGFFRGVSKTYAEAAFMDGASNLKVFFSIMMPIAKGILMTIGLMTFIGSWNDYMTPLLYLPSYTTLASGLYNYQKVIVYKASYPLYFAGIIISMVPILILYAAFQKTLLENAMMGGIKG